MTQPQHLTALQRANELRLARAALKRELGSLPRQEAFGMLADIVENPPACCERAQPLELLMACRFMGRHFALRWLRKSGVQEGRRLGELSVRQRCALAGLLRSSEGRRVAA